jgi:SAM-dependent methyltransferase
MLDKTVARAQKAGLDKIIRPLLCNGDGIGERLELDFALASNSLHETPNPAETLRELFGMLKPGGRFLLMEPRHHLKAAEFEAEVALAKEGGFMEIDRPEVTREWCVLLQKPEL